MNANQNRTNEARENDATTLEATPEDITHLLLSTGGRWDTRYGTPASDRTPVLRIRGGDVAQGMSEPGVRVRWREGMEPDASIGPGHLPTAGEVSPVTGKSGAVAVILGHCMGICVGGRETGARQLLEEGPMGVRDWVARAAQNIAGAIVDDGIVPTDARRDGDDPDALAGVPSGSGIQLEVDQVELRDQLEEELMGVAALAVREFARFLRDHRPDVDVDLDEIRAVADELGDKEADL
jgi:hypothetical protein